MYESRDKWLPLPSSPRDMHVNIDPPNPKHASDGPRGENLQVVALGKARTRSLSCERRAPYLWLAHLAVSRSRSRRERTRRASLSLDGSST